MARGTGTTSGATAGTTNVGATPQQRTRRDATAAPTRTGGRHAGPYGASFDGTEPDGSTRARGLTFEPDTSRHSGSGNS